jgi:FtsH-binding integral membrane protein
VTENNESKFTQNVARRRLALEALVLLVFAWIAAIVTSLFRPGPMASSANYGVWQFIGSTFVTGLECFVFGYVLSRFFKQFKTGCAFVIILFFIYLVWAGRHPR